MLRYGLVALIAVATGCSGSMAESGELGDSGSGGDSGHSGTASKGGRGGRGAAGSSAGPGKGGSGNGAQAGNSSGTGGARAGRAGSGSGGSSGSSSNAATGGGAASGATSNHTNPLSQALIDAFVKAHNDARRSNLVPAPSPELPLVTWDDVLADTAYNYLSKCQSTDGGLVDHNANRTKDYAALGGSAYVGENIFASSASSVVPKDAVDSWMGEASDYVPGDAASAGHYTQVVWRDSVRIGCAIVNCPSVRFHNTVLCDYAPGGNINGKTPY
jgi:pathogenesis-related protein 1